MYLDTRPAVKLAKYLGNIDDDLPDHRPHLPSILQCQRAKKSPNRKIQFPKPLDLGNAPDRTFRQRAAGRPLYSQLPDHVKKLFKQCFKLLWAIPSEPTFLPFSDP